MKSINNIFFFEKKKHSKQCEWVKKKYYEIVHTNKYGIQEIMRQNAWVVNLPNDAAKFSSFFLTKILFNNVKAQLHLCSHQIQGN